jgi:hypothetical protein
MSEKQQLHFDGLLTFLSHFADLLIIDCNHMIQHAASFDTQLQLQLQRFKIDLDRKVNYKVHKVLYFEANWMKTFRKVISEDELKCCKHTDENTGNETRKQQRKQKQNQKTKHIHKHSSKCV